MYYVRMIYVVFCIIPGRPDGLVCTRSDYPRKILIILPLVTLVHDFDSHRGVIFLLRLQKIKNGSTAKSA